MCIVADMVTRQRISWDKGRRRLLQACPENAVGTCYDPKSGAASLQNLWNRHELAVIGGGASREIQVAWGMRLLSQGREAAALHWLSRGRSPLVQELANKTLMSYVTASEPVGMQKMEPLLKYVDSGGSDDLITSSTRGDTAVILVRNFFRIRKLLEQRGGGRRQAFGGCKPVEGHARSIEPHSAPVLARASRIHCPSHGGGWNDNLLVG